MAGLTISNRNGFGARPTPSASGGPPRVAHPGPVVAKRRVSTVDLVISVRDDAWNVAWMLEQIAEYVNEITLVEGDPDDAAVITALCEHSGIKLVPRETGGPHLGWSTQAGTRGKLHAEPIG